MKKSTKTCLITIGCCLAVAGVAGAIFINANSSAKNWLSEQTTVITNGGYQNSDIATVLERLDKAVSYGKDIEKVSFSATKSVKEAGAEAVITTTDYVAKNGNISVVYDDGTIAGKAVEDSSGGYTITKGSLNCTTYEEVRSASAITDYLARTSELDSSSKSGWDYQVEFLTAIKTDNSNVAYEKYMVKDGGLKIVLNGNLGTMACHSSTDQLTTFELTYEGNYLTHYRAVFGACEYLLDFDIA